MGCTIPHPTFGATRDRAARWAAAAVLLVAVTAANSAEPRRPPTAKPSAQQRSAGKPAARRAGASVASFDEDPPPEADSKTSKPQPSGKAKREAEDAADHPFPKRLPAPKLTGGSGWINTSGPLDVKDLRGKFVLLDFWTYCCINCMHILPELKKLEAAYPNELVVIGVHSAKFETEEDSKNIREAVLRYEIAHPVVNDAKHAIWDRYGIRSWPTVVLIDPDGNAVYGRSGEFRFEEIDAVLRHGLPYYRKRGKLDTTPLHFDLEVHRAEETPLRFPGKVLADAVGKRLFIADSNHNRIVVATLDGTLLETIGSGEMGAADGDYEEAAFNHPQGMALAGRTLLVADTENHMLRKVDLAEKTVTTIAGTGRQAASGEWPGMDPTRLDARGGLQLPHRWVGTPRTTDLNSPWDLWVHDHDLFIAMAGPHQIWKMPLDETEIGPYAGNGREDIVDGPLLPPEPYAEGFASFAQPSGLASDGVWLYVADSEGSSIRAVPFDPTLDVRTVVGTSHLAQGRLFAFGDKDGKGRLVRLQHALGVAFQAGKLYVADTYNNKIKVINLDKQTVQTIAGTGKPGREDRRASDALAEFDEPAGLSVAGNKLYVADTNNHLIRTIDLASGNRVSTLEIRGLKPPQAAVEDDAAAIEAGQKVDVPPVALKPLDGLVWLAVKLELPEGYKINAQAPMRYRVEAAGKSGPLDRTNLGRAIKVDPPEREFQIELPLSADTGADTVQIWLGYYYCQESDEGVCKSGSVTWTVPIKLSAAAKKSTAPLVLQVE